MSIIYRQYRNEDYSTCEHLVSEAWGFEKLFSSKVLQDIAKYFYTKGALSSSTYKMVATHKGKVVGFLFGINTNLNKNPFIALSLIIKMNFDLNFKKIDNDEKQVFIDAIKKHHINRSKVASKKLNEIVLFVVSPTYQGKGIGTKLWADFKKSCLN